jgi:hypothetical protein
LCCKTEERDETNARKHYSTLNRNGRTPQAKPRTILSDTR